VYEILRESKEYGLKDQMMRSAISILSNISEGAERDSKSEFIRFLHIAKGSAAELRTQLYLASAIGAIGADSQKELVEELKTISSMFHSLIKSINPPKTLHLKLKT